MDPSPSPVDDSGRDATGADTVASGLIPTAHAQPAVEDVAATADVVPIDLRDYVVFSPDHATRVRALDGGTLAVDLWCIEPQQSTGVLQYPDADVAYMVVGGRSWFVTDQGEVGLDPMGSLMVPAGTIHGIDNRGADPLIVSMAMAPPDDRDPASPHGPSRAIRDDSRFGATRRQLKATVSRFLAR